MKVRKNENLNRNKETRIIEVRGLIYKFTVEHIPSGRMLLYFERKPRLYIGCFKYEESMLESMYNIAEDEFERMCFAITHCFEKGFPYGTIEV